jgi:hypothetical protein
MRRDDVINILCKLKYSCDEFPTMMTNFLYEFGDREYEITFQRDAGRIIKFTVDDVGLSKEKIKEMEVEHEGN